MLSTISAPRKHRFLLSTKWGKLTPKISHFLLVPPEPQRVPYLKSHYFNQSVAWYACEAALGKERYAYVRLNGWKARRSVCWICITKGAVISYAREGAGREIQIFAKNFIAPVRFQIFFHSPSEKLYLVSWPSSAAYAFLSTLKSMNCQMNAISKATV